MRIELAQLLNRAFHGGIDVLRFLFEEAERAMLTELRRLRFADGSPRFVGHGIRPRAGVTRMGRVAFRPRRVRDRMTGHTFAPLLAALGLGKRRYTPEVRLAAAEMATRTSHGEASEAAERTFGSHVPRRTIWNSLRERALGVERALYFPLSPPPVPGSVHEADTTVVKGQWRRGAQIAADVGMTMDPSHHVHVAEVGVGWPPTSVPQSQSVDHLVTNDDFGLMAYTVRAHQLCRLHFVSLLGILLQEEGVGLRGGEEILAPLRGLLAHLRNSLAHHRLRGERWAITERMRATLGELEAGAQKT